MSTAIETQDERDEQVAEAITSGRSLRAVRKEFGLSQVEIDSVLERLWPIHTAARITMIKHDLSILTRLCETFYQKALAGCTQSGLCVIRVLERKHELLGMNSAVKIEIAQGLALPWDPSRAMVSILSTPWEP
jgi:hypothetical protein